ncbi:MAG: hypothetical protein IT236_09060, partial [Bacteroidia bacterium]|nr:hypothetical protein [Bacteroidia bacterium]
MFKINAVNIIFFLSSVFCDCVYGQNQTQKWYFGVNAGLNFATNPPSVLTNGSVIAYEGSASISDAAGNILFYTNGNIIYNKNHVVM